jgi:hypothetical protein
MADALGTAGTLDTDSRSAMEHVRAVHDGHAPRPEPLPTLPHLSLAQRSLLESTAGAIAHLRRGLVLTADLEALRTLETGLMFVTAWADRAQRRLDEERAERAAFVATLIAASEDRAAAERAARAFLRRPDSVSSSTHGELLGLVERLCR